MKKRHIIWSYVRVVCIVMVSAIISLTFNVIPAKASTTSSRPLIGVINYDAWLGHVEGAADINSLTPEKWAYRLPYYAEVYDDTARLTRNNNNPGSFVYHFTSQITGFKVYAAFDGSKSIDMANDIKIYYSPDNITYTEYIPKRNNINATSNGWKKVTYYGYNSGTADAYANYPDLINIPSNARYLKITINKTDDVSTNPQIMRVEVCYNTADSFFTLFKDDLYDFNSMYSHDNNLVIISNNSSDYRLVTGTSNTQQRVDEQIEFAKSANIDYFAVVDVPHNNTLMGNRTIDLIKTSSYKNDIKYCVVIHYPTEEIESWTDRTNRYVGYFRDSNYVTVCNGRPLVYIFNTDSWTSTEMNQLRSATQSAGLANPYIVGMGGSGFSYCDAGSCYGGISQGLITPYGGPNNQTVPCVSFGGNDQPRTDNPPPWGGCNFNDPELSPSQMAGYVDSGIQWCFNHSSSVEAWTMVMYAWNEFAEGAGHVCPTRDSSGNPNTSALDAIGNVIKSYGNNNLISNPGFESGNASGWSISSGTNNCFNVRNSGYSGSYSMEMTNTAAWQDNLYQNINVEPNTNYTFSFWDWGTAATCYYDVCDTSWSQLASGSSTVTSQWTKYSLSFNSGNCNQVIIRIANTGTGTHYLDDFDVSQNSSNPVSNPGFESSNASGWSISSGTNNCFNVRNSGYSGLYSMEMTNTAAWQDNLYQNINVQPNTNYTFSFWDWGTAATCYYDVCDTSWIKLASGSTTVTNQWTKYSLSFNSGNRNQVIIRIANTGTGTHYLDDFDVH